MTDYNQAGQNYQALTVGANWDGYGQISTEAAVYFQELLREGNSRKNPVADKILGLFDRLKSTLYHSHLATSHLKIMTGPEDYYFMSLPKEMREPPYMLVYRNSELNFEIEAILFSIGAALDTFANICRAEINGFDKSPRHTYFSNVKKSLRAAVRDDFRANLLERLISECEATFAEPRKIRNLVAHETGFQEQISVDYVFHSLDDGRLLRFDLEIEGRPFTRTVRELVWTLTYLIAGAARIFLTVDRRRVAEQELFDAWDVERTMFEPAWENALLGWRDYRAPNGQGILFTISKLGARNVTLEQVHLNEDILSLAQHPAS